MRLRLVWLIVAALDAASTIAGTGRMGALEGQLMLEAFLGEQAAVVAPLHLGLPIRTEREGDLSERLGSLAERLLAAAEGPDGVIMRASLIEALELDGISSMEPVPGDDEDEREMQSVTFARAYNWHRRHRAGARPVEFGRAVKGLKASIKSCQLEFMLEAFDSRELGADLHQDANRAGARSDEGRAEAALVLEAGGEERLAEITKHVNETLARMPPDEELRFRLATVEAYGLEPAGLTCGQCEIHDSSCQSDTTQPGRVKRSLIPSIRLAGARACRAIWSACDILKRLVHRAIEIGFGIFDRLTTTSQFLEDLPIIGERLRAMRARAAPLIEMIEEVRRIHYLYKVKNAPNGVERLGADETEATKTRSAASDELPQQAAASEGAAGLKLLISKQVNQALDRLSTLLVRDLGLSDKTIRSAQVEEIVSRHAYALLVWLLAPAE